MPFRLTCPNGHGMQIRDEHAGRRVKCPVCAEGFLAQAPAAPQVAPPAPQTPPNEEVVDYVPEDDAPHDESGAPPRKKKHRWRTRSSGKRRGPPVFWIMLAGGGLALVGIGVVLWWFVGAPLVERMSFPILIPQPPDHAHAADTPAYRFHVHLKTMKSKHGERQVIVVCIKGLPDGETKLAFERFMSLGFKSEDMPIAIQTGDNQEFTWIVLGPVPDAEALAKRIDFGRVVSVSSERIDIVADLSKFPGVLETNPVSKALAVIRSSSSTEGARGKALESLHKLSPDHRRAEVAAELEKFLLEDPSGFVRSSAAVALGAWGSKDNVPALLRAVEDKEGFFMKARALEALGQLKDERALPTLVAHLPDRHAVVALKAMGPMAESAVIPCLQHDHDRVCEGACIILKAIGTNASVPALEEVTRSRNRDLVALARDALANITARAKP